jgi:hypothetical protein
MALSVAALRLSGGSLLRAVEEPALHAQEQRFAAMLRDSFWSGYWYRQTDQGLQLGGSDEYHIIEARKVADDHWMLVVEFQLQGKPMRASLPARMYWAQDTAVVTMDDLRLPQEPPFTVRVVFRGGMYTGLFFSEKLTGAVLGAQRSKAPR